MSRDTRKGGGIPFKGLPSQNRQVTTSESWLWSRTVYHLWVRHDLHTYLLICLHLYSGFAERRNIYLRRVLLVRTFLSSVLDVLRLFLPGRWMEIRTRLPKRSDRWRHWSLVPSEVCLLLSLLRKVKVTIFWSLVRPYRLRQTKTDDLVINLES